MNAQFNWIFASFFAHMRAINELASEKDRKVIITGGAICPYRARDKVSKGKKVSRHAMALDQGPGLFLLIGTTHMVNNAERRAVDDVAPNVGFIWFIV